MDKSDTKRLFKIKTVLKSVIETLKFQRILRLSLCALFHISNQPSGMQLILDSSSLNNLDSPNSAFTNIGQSLHAANRPPRVDDKFLRLIASLVECVSVSNESCYKYALLILHNILCGKNAASKRVVEFVRDERALGLVTEWLGVEKNEKLLSIIVDIVQIVCDKNSEQKVLISIRLS